MTHRPFILRICRSAHSAGSEADLVAQVIESPKGQSTAVRFRPPPMDADLEAITRAIAWRTRRRGLRHLLSVGPRDEAPDLLAIGRRLSEAVFHGAVGRTLLRCLGSDEGAGRVGIRVTIRIDPELAEAEQLHGLPWEVLMAPGDDRHLALDPRTPVVRYLEVSQGEGPPTRPETLHILAVAPRPLGVTDLGADRELDDLRRAWNDAASGTASPPVRVEVLEPPTLEALHNALRADPVHVLHFSGHGRSARPRSRPTGRGRAAGGQLLFQDAGLGVDPVDAELLAGQLVGVASSLRVVVLNACETARGGQPRPVADSDRTEGEPAAGPPLVPAVSVAAALVEAGVPAVVAMQQPITDRAALTFSRALYDRLAQGDPIDVAVTEGRLALCREHRSSVEWATPALFLRSRDARVFAQPERPASGEGTATGSAGRMTPRTEGGAETGRRGGRWRRTTVGVGLAVALVSAGLLVQQRLVGRSPGDGEGERVDEPVTRSSSALPGRAEGASERTSDDVTTGALPTTDPTETRRTEPVPDAGRFRTISAGETVRLDQGALSVAVDFVEVAGEEMARITVAGPDGQMVREPLLGPGHFTVDSAGRTLHVQVTVVDFAAHTVTLGVLPP